jgi:catechol 2,3-dioxygenase-like lactoylglutathione lyase family enzyme
VSVKPAIRNRIRNRTLTPSRRQPIIRASCELNDRGGAMLPRRDFLGALIAPAAILPRGVMRGFQSSRQASVLPIRVLTVNHISFGCVDVKATVAWFGRVFGLPVHAFQDYGSGQTVVRVGDGPAYMALSQRNKNSLGQPPNRRPHFCWGIEDFNVDRILRALSEMQAPAQAVLREGKTINGVNFDDPDGFPLQFNPVTACGGGGFLGDVCDAKAQAVRPPGAPPAIPVKTLNHVRMVVPNLQRALAWHLKLTDLRPLPGDGPTKILRVGPGPQFVAMSEGNGPEAFTPHVGFGVQGFNADQIMARLSEHGITGRRSVRDGTPEILLDSPDGIEIQLQDVSYCGGRGPLGSMCG